MKQYFPFIVIFSFIVLLGAVNIFLPKLPKTFALKSSPSPTTSPVLTATPFPTAFPTLVPTASLTPIPTSTPTPIDWQGLYGPCQYVPILMYHHITDNESAKAIEATYLNVPPEIFRKQLDYLASKGYNIIGLDEMVAMIKDNSLPPKPVVLTFDDAYRNFYDTAYPILKEKNAKATVFVITQFVGGERYVTWEQLMEMGNSGLILIGNHALNHPYLSKISPEEVRNQIISARNIIEKNTGKSTDFFAYPYGNSSAKAKEVLKEAGYKGAVLTTNTNPQCLGRPYDFSRIRVGATSLSRYGL
ncbi:MAG: polysaccharide deacetylase family protein [Patescibacteria group bacterium]